MSLQPASNPSASSTGSATTGDDRSVAFSSKDGSGEAVPGGSLMVAAYAVVWVVVLLLVVRVFQRQSAVARQLGELEADLRKRPQG